MRTKDTLITPEKCKDSGLALVLICLLCYQAWKLNILMLLAIVFLLLTMTWPRIFKPFARLWFGLSAALGTIVSKIILSVLFFVLVYPTGLIRRAMGKDAMQLKSWKKENTSFFKVRAHRYQAKDLQHPY